MSLLTSLRTLLNPLAAGGAHPTVLPDPPQFPSIVFQIVGGRATWYTEKKIPSHRHARVQVVVWATRELDALALIQSVEKAFCEGALYAEPYGAAVSADGNLDPLDIRGYRQDFGVWYPAP